MGLERLTPSRRGVLGSLGGALAAVTVGGCGALRGAALVKGPTTRQLRQATQIAFSGLARPLVMQVLAHPDDDLFFMNPDTVSTVERGVPVVSVYVTSGGSLGENQVLGQSAPRTNVAAYVSARQQGLRQGYARMLGADIFTRWARTAMTLPGGRRAEINTLMHDGRRADLVFLNIDMHTKVSGGTVGMSELWGKTGTTVLTVLLRDSPVRRVYPYTRQSLTDTLAFLFSTYRPTLIRTLDPDPDIQVDDATHPIGDDQPGYSDHPDHTATGLFTWRAMAQYAAETSARGGTPVFLSEAYRGYYNQRWPHNLPADTVRSKVDYLDAYGGDPTWACGNAQGCGDYGVGHGETLNSPKGWVRSTHYRYPTAGPQVLEGGGRLSVYGVVATRAARWVETQAGSGTWSAPEDLGGGPLAPALSVVTSADGRELLFGLRFSGLEAAATGNTRQIVGLEQKTPGGAFNSTWISLGNPETDPVRGRRVGPPTALTGPDGQIHVFVRNASKGLSTRVRDTAGRWSPWQQLSGGQIQEGLTATLDDAGRIHVFAIGRGDIHHWTQETPQGLLTYRSLLFAAPPAEIPDTVITEDGSLLLAYRVPDTAQILVERLSTGLPEQWTPVAQVDGAGFGPVSLLAGQNSSTGPLLVVRTGTGAAMLLDAEQGVPPESGAAAFAVGKPAVLTVGLGRTALVTLGLNAVPAVSRSNGAVGLTRLANGGAAAQGT